jgi:hypothetical protein
MRIFEVIFGEDVPRTILYWNQLYIIHRLNAGYMYRNIQYIHVNISLLIINLDMAS